MGFVRLETSRQNSSLKEKVGESRHIERIEKVDFEKVPVSNCITVEWYTFDQGDMCDKGGRRSIVGIAAVGEGQSMID